MMATITSYAKRWQRTLRQWVTEPVNRVVLLGAAKAAGGFLLSAASLAGTPQPLVLGMLCSLSGWSAVLVSLGGLLGYPVFWGRAGIQGMVWTVCGLIMAVLTGKRSMERDTPLLQPAAAALTVAASGLAFQIWFSDPAGVWIYLLRIALGAGSAVVFCGEAQRKDVLSQWLACALWVLALAQVAPFGWLSLGHIALGAVSVSAAFPAAVLSGLAVDLAGVTAVPMAAVACLIYLGRLVPTGKKWSVYLLPGIGYVMIMSLCGKWDLMPLPGLVCGGLLGYLMPGQVPSVRRRGATAVAQVRLEMVAEVFAQAQQLLLETAVDPIDETALIQRGADKACSACPARKSCKERDSVSKMPPLILHRPLLDGEDIPAACRKPGRLLSELHRSQEQLRTIRADRERQNEYRAALIQQYRFLSLYLQELSDELGRRGPKPQARYRVEVSVAANRPQAENGDRCFAFAGVECRYYVILCDGMGTGTGAVEEGIQAGRILKRLLCAGFPAEYALRSLNSLCALRSRAGAVTVDLAELQLDSGKVNVYKWGAAPSWVLRRAGSEKIGTATPPPGFSVTEGREAVERLSLRRGEVLVLLSDGVGGEDALHGCALSENLLPGELAARILENGDPDTGDDATVAVVRLCPNSLGA